MARAKKEAEAEEVKKGVFPRRSFLSLERQTYIPTHCYALKKWASKVEGEEEEEEFFCQSAVLSRLLLREGSHSHTQISQSISSSSLN